jgi:hypothetical protein
MRSIYSIHMFYPIIYAFAAHEHRHVPRARARQERVLDGRAIDDDVARRSAPTCACDSAGPRWSTAPRFAIHRSAATIFRRVCVIVIQMQRMRRERRFLLECPRSCCRYGGRCRSEEGGPVPSSTKIAFPRRLTAPRSMAGGRLVDPRPSRPSSSMGRRPSDGSWSLALADAWRCPASAKASSESIDGAGFRCPNRLGAGRASVGRARRLGAARRTARAAACVREGARRHES